MTYFDGKRNFRSSDEFVRELEKLSNVSVWH